MNYRIINKTVLIPLFTLNLCAQQAPPPSYSQALAQSAPHDLIPLLIAEMAQALMPTVAPPAFQSALSPHCNKRTVVKGNYVTDKGAAVIMALDNPSKSIEKGFHVHARLLGIATKNGFYPCFQDNNQRLQDGAPSNLQRFSTSIRNVSNYIDDHTLNERLRAFIGLDNEPIPLVSINAPAGIYAYPIRDLRGIADLMNDFGLPSQIPINNRATQVSRFNAIYGDEYDSLTARYDHYKKSLPPIFVGNRAVSRIDKVLTLAKAQLKDNVYGHSRLDV